MENALNQNSEQQQSASTQKNGVEFALEKVNKLNESSNRQLPDN